MDQKPNNFWRRISKRSKRIFLKSLLITTFSIVLAVGIGAFVWTRAIAPPTVPTMGQRPLLPVVRLPGIGSGSEDPYDDYYFDIEYAWPAPERFTDDDVRDMFWTFLIIGLNEGTNANTVMVASYCGLTREANLISIPRDVPVHPTRRGRKLSSSYIAGSGGGRGREGGIAQVQRDVMNVIGFVPDFHILIDYDAFFTIIDAIGGIDIYVPMRMRYTDPHQNLNIDFQPGMQHMNSREALEFSRFRMANRGYQSITDFQRVENQQAVINAVISRMLRPANILNIPEFVSIFNESVDTNLTVRNMMWFALELNHIRGTDALSTYTFLPTHGSGRPMYYEFLSAENVLELINRTVNPFYQDIEARDLNIIRS